MSRPSHLVPTTEERREEIVDGVDESVQEGHDPSWEMAHHQPQELFFVVRVRRVPRPNVTRSRPDQYWLVVPAVRAGD